MKLSHPVVLVHGNPESTALWGPLQAQLPGLDPILVSPPGFGVEADAEFDASLESYVSWLGRELSRLDQPVHLLGHDWGGVLTLLLAMRRPDLLRSWTSDCLGVFDPEYVFHPLAREWQTDGAGEVAISRQFGGDVASRARVLEDFGIPAPMAGVLAADQVPSLVRVVLPLYRSIAQPVMSNHGANLDSAAATPGLSILAEQDPVLGSQASRLQAATRARAQTVRLSEAGHWWMLDQPATAATALSRFWLLADQS